MKNNSGIRVILETRYNRGDDHFPVKIAITFTVISKGKKKWLQKYFPTGHYVTESEFVKITGNDRISDRRLIDIRDQVHQQKSKAITILAGNPTPDQFKTLFTSMGDLHNVIDHFDRYAQQCEDEGRISSRDSYQNAASSFIAFSSRYLTFGEINQVWLKKYERWGLNKGLSINTIGIYLRNLRAIFNQVITEPYRLVPQEAYPFGNGGYKIKKKRGGKWAPSGAEIAKILNYQTKYPVVKKAVAFWSFSYFAYGINPADIAQLRFKNVINGEIHLDRVKTINTEHEGKTILIPVREEMKRVIQVYGNKSLNKNDYIFPILVHGLTPAQIKSRIHDFKAEINEGLKILSDKDHLNFGNELKFGVARHAFATTLMRKGVTTEFIQNALGHGDPEVTQNYLDGFDTETRRKMSDLLAG